MKRTMIISVLAAACMMATGCKEEKCDWEAFNGSGPNPCFGEPDCEDYPPEGVTISWNDYNTVAELVDYFDCHRKTQMEHMGDTLKFMGWLDESWITGPEYVVSDSTVTWTMLTDDTNQYGPEDKKSMRIKSDNPLDLTPLRGRKLYITGMYAPFMPGLSDCCSIRSEIYILSIDFD